MEKSLHKVIKKSQQEIYFRRVFTGRKR